MRRLASSGCITVVAATLLMPSAADADVVSVYEDLTERRLSPAPLVFTTVPRSLGPLDANLQSFGSRRSRGYGLRILKVYRNGSEGIVAFEGGSFKTMRALLREHRRLGYKRRGTRVRGKRGYLLTRRLGGRLERQLAWIERGRVYSIGSGTARKVSLRQLRSIAAALDRLGGFYIGTSSDPQSSTEASALTTERTISAYATWDARCTRPGSTEPNVRVGSAKVTLLRRQGSRFSFDIARNPAAEDSDPWAGTVSGTISRDSIDVNIRATGTIDGESCDSGPLAFSIPRSR